MIEWFQAGGWGMFILLATGGVAIAVGVMALRDPTDGRMAALRSLPALIGLLALFTFGTDLWAVNVNLSDAAVLAERGLTADAMTALFGVTEAGQALTLGGLLAAIVVTLRLFADVKKTKLAKA